MKRSALSRAILACLGTVGFSSIAFAQNYEIVHKPTGLKIASCGTSDGDTIITTTSPAERDCGLWERIDTDGHFILTNKLSGRNMRPDSNAKGAEIVIQPSSWSGNWSQWRYEDRGDGYGHIINRATGLQLFAAAEGEGQALTQRPTSWRGNYTRWVFNEVSDVANVPPTGSIIAPSEVNEGETINVIVDGADSDGDVTLVAFYYINNLGQRIFLGTAPGVPAEFQITDTVAATYGFEAHIGDNDGAFTTVTGSTLVVGASGENIAPTVSLEQPTGELSTDGFTINANAADTDGTIESVTLHYRRSSDLDSVISLTDTEAPFSWFVDDVVATSYIAWATTEDNEGATGESTNISFNVVQGSGGDNILPTVSIQTPPTGLQPGDDVVIYVDASDEDGSIVKTELYYELNGINWMATTPDPDSNNGWLLEDLREGDYVLTARAFDNEEAVVVSEPVNMRVGNGNPVDNEPAQTILQAPTGDFTEGGEITFEASATDPDGFVTRVSLQIREVGSDIVSSGAADQEAPYIFTRSLRAGTYVAYAIAFDNFDMIGDPSNEVTFTISPAE